MSRSALQHQRQTLTPLAVITAAALIFTVLLVLVRLQWRPLESADHDAAARLNNLIAGQRTLVTVVRDVTLLGSTLALSVVIAAAVVLLVLRRRWWLAAYLIVTGAGALVLDPVLKVLVGRLRPVVAHPVAHAPGNSFPSGHALGSLVCYGALFLVFLPAARGRWRTCFGIGIAVLIALIGISRILLGVHFISDVVGGWAIGIAWLGLTSLAFELTRHVTGHPVSNPVARGLEPDAEDDLRPAEPEPVPQHRGRTAAAVAVAWVLILGIIVGIGEHITKAGNGNELGDTTIPRWLAAHRTPSLTSWSLVFTTLGGTAAIATAVAVICLVFVAVTRRWRPATFMVTLIIGELALFLAAAAVVKRPRPPVSHLDHHLPTSSYPSGHVAATCCVYIGLAILVIGHCRGWWRWLFVVPAIALPLLVAASRMYRGEHHPTDVLASICFAALWIPAVSWLIKPNAAGRARTRSRHPRGQGITRRALPSLQPLNSTVDRVTRRQNGQIDGVIRSSMLATTCSPRRSLIVTRRIASTCSSATQ
jgi:undecaprenyl-diphosphatase